MTPMPEPVALPLSQDHRRRTGSVSVEIAVEHDGARASERAGGPRALEITERERWNALLLGLDHYEIEQSWDWGEMQRAEGWVPHRYAVLAGSRRVAAISVASRRLPGVPYSVLYASRGPLLTADTSAARAITDALRGLAARERAIFLRVSPSVLRGRMGSDTYHSFSIHFCRRDPQEKEKPS